jgi:uncharacterized Tic20 family protein
MTNQNMSVPTPDERILAALAHITILVPLMGVIAPILIWVTQKDKSRYVGFQALQAVVFQLLLVLTWFLGMGCYMASFFISFIGMAGFGAGNPSSTPTSSPGEVFGVVWVLIPFLVFGLMILAGLAFVIYGIIAAIQALRGTPFRYALIGDRVERFLQAGKPVEEPSADAMP